MSTTRIRDYIIEARIGVGGMGTVYRASHVHLGTKAALKILLEYHSGNSSIRQRFISEARILHGLQHRNIVEQKEFFEEENRLVLVLEYIDGCGLDRIIGQEIGPIPFEKAIPLFRQILAGIGYAHSKGVIHRDIKPSNILVSKEGRVKIADLGIAKLAGRKGMTRTGTKLGTLYYMSPEQVRGVEVDIRSDIYALGMTLYEMLAGRLPFDEDSETSEFEIMRCITGRTAHFDPREHYPHIPEWLVKTIRKATHLDPEKRFQNCGQIQAVLRKYGKAISTDHEYWSGKASRARQSAPVVPADIESSREQLELKCSACGCSVPGDMKFCGNCGESLRAICPECKASVGSSHNFCPECGAEMSKPATSEGPVPSNDFDPAELFASRPEEEATVTGEPEDQFSRLRGIFKSDAPSHERFLEEYGLVTDRNTGLIWKLNRLDDISWKQATKWVSKIGPLWRMPDRSELRALYEAGISLKNWGPFSTTGRHVWSRELFDSRSAWFFDFDMGWEAWTAKSESEGKRVYAVRDYDVLK